MSASEAVMHEREKIMTPHPWFKAEPLIRLSLNEVLIDKERKCAYVTLKAVADAMAEKEG